MQLNRPKLVWFDEIHLRWQNVVWWKVLPIYSIVLIIWAVFFFLAGSANARVLVKTEYVYFPCARTLEKQQGGGTHWVWKDVYKEFERTQFKQPIQLIINK
jgi:hypothetical protein